VVCPSTKHEPVDVNLKFVTLTFPWLASFSVVVKAKAVEPSDELSMVALQFPFTFVLDPLLLPQPAIATMSANTAITAVGLCTSPPG
jgi:uncharacterized protein YceK